MKHLCLVFLTLCTVLSVNAQEQNETVSQQNYNEFKLNALSLVLGAFDVTYERTLNEESAFGISVFIPFDEDISDDINYYISPYYRFYFGKKYAAGFFIEGFGMLNSTKSDNFFFGDDVFIEEENVTDFALGVGVGGKWVTKSGFVGELNVGVGRNLFNSDESGDDLVAKVGVTLGYRF